MSEVIGNKSDTTGGTSLVALVKLVDSIVDSIQTDTTSIESKVDTVDTVVDSIQTDTTAILEDTGTTIPGELTSIDGKIDTIDANVDAILLDTTDGSKVVSRAAASLPQAAALNLFSCSNGLVRIDSIIGVVTGVIGNVANNTKLQVFCNATTTDICAVSDIDSDAEETLYSITGTFANAMTVTGPDIPIENPQPTPVTLPFGSSGQPVYIKLNCAGADGEGGKISWHVRYTPLSEGATLVAE